MAAIDIGNSATNRASGWSNNYTTIDLANAANDTGKITSVELRATDAPLTGVKVGIFYLVSGTTYGVRSVTTLGTVTHGSKQTFSVDLDVQTGDFIGYYSTSGVGTLEADTTGGSGVMYKSGDSTGGNNSYTNLGGISLSLYGIGATLSVGPANLKTYNTNLKANIKSINGNPIANVKSLNTNI